MSGWLIAFIVLVAAILIEEIVAQICHTVTNHTVAKYGHWEDKAELKIMEGEDA